MDNEQVRALNFRINASLADLLDEFVKVTGLRKTAAVEKLLVRSLEDWFSNYDKDNTNKEFQKFKNSDYRKNFVEVKEYR